MPKIFNCWFWKKQNEGGHQSSVASESSGAEQEQVYSEEKPQRYKLDYSKTSDTIYHDPEQLKTFSKKPGKKNKSYPSSPVRTSKEDRGYLSDHKPKRIKRESLPFKRDSAIIYTARMRESNEPFPYHIPTSVPRRSSLFYGVSNLNDAIDPPKSAMYTAEKPMEDNNMPSTSLHEHRPTSFQGNEDGNENMFKRGRRVTIQTPNIYEDENYAQHESVRKTFVRFRPHSFIGNRGPSESVKRMSLQANQVEHPPMVLSKRVHQIPLKPTREAPVLMTDDGRKLHPVQTDKLRRMSIWSQNEDQPIRTSVVEPNREDEYSFPFKSSEDPIVYAGPVNHNKQKARRPSIRHSVVYRGSVDGRRYSVRGGNTESQVEQPFPFVGQENQPLVYAVPAVPTRGRTRSILHQSVKSLASKNARDEPVIHKKNIRYSRDADVFSAESRRRSMAPSSPGYINMEKGQPMLVSEFLNPISSLFISDLKDTVPKDPLTKPKESNVWVKPRSRSVQRESIHKQPPKHSPRVHIVYKDTPKAHVVPTQRRVSRSRHNYREQSPSSSEESIEVYREKSKKAGQKKSYYQHAVYAAQMPDATLPIAKTETGKNPPFKKKGKVLNDQPEYIIDNDFCGLNCEAPEETDFNTSQVIDNAKMIPSAQKTDVEDDEMDLLCYPSEKFLKSTAFATESGSKLRWRIIIKRGDEK